ncbi:MAG: hypothetical protein HYU66_09270 [Armatimonadetes bacterium]|nr:hypothetical protein [Armatimonadota bacterium]
MSEWLTPRRLVPELLLAAWVILVAGLYYEAHARPAWELVRAVLGG